MSSETLLDSLSAFSPAQFDRLVCVLDLDASALLPATNPVTSRAVELVRHVEALGRLHDLEWELERLRHPKLSSSTPARPVAPFYAPEVELVGRGALLHEIRAALTNDSLRGVVLHGISGIGKSAIAQVVASDEKYRADFPGGVFWVSGGSWPLLLASLESLDVGLDGSDPEARRTTARAALRYLQEVSERTLLCVDNLDVTASWVQEKVTRLHRSPIRFLITTTHRPTGWFQHRAQWIEVGALDAAAAGQLVRPLAPQRSAAEIAALLEFFERHTLAVEVAARTLHGNVMLDVGDYLDKVRERADALPDAEVGDAPRTALSAMEVAFAHVSDAARRVLALCGSLGDAPVPIDWLRCAASLAPGGDDKVARGVAEVWNRHLATIVDSHGTKLIRLHPLVRLIARARASAADQQAMLSGLRAWLPECQDAGVAVKVALLRAHADSVWAAAEGDAAIATRLSFALRDRGHRRDLERALAIITSVRGAGELEADVACEHAATLWARSEPTHREEAERLMRHAIALCQRRGKENDVGLADALHDLAMLHSQRGGAADLRESETLLQRALDMKRAALPKDHPSLASTLAMYASVQWKLGGRRRLAKTEELLEEALRLKQQRFGEHSPALVQTLNLLALVLRDIGGEASLRAAEEHLRRALRIDQLGLQEKQPRTAITLFNLSLVLRDRGGCDRLCEAAQLLARCAAIEESALGPEARALVPTLFNAAAVQLEIHALDARAADLSAALALLARARRIAKRNPDITTPGPDDFPRLAAALRRARRGGPSGNRN